MTCGGSGVLTTIKFVASLLDIVCVIVPIVLLLMLSFDFAVAVLSKEDDMKKKTSLAVKRVISCAVIFLLPNIITFVLALFSSIGVEYAECVKIAKEGSDFSQYDLNISSKYSDNTIDLSTNKGSVTIADNDSSTSSGKGKILLIAGHSFAPYCANASRECRPTNLKYEEPVETRKLVQLIKSELIKIGYKKDDVDIANELLGEDFNDKSTSKSLFVEASNNRDSLDSKVKLSQYKFAIEIHFNAFNGYTSGVMTPCLSSDCGIGADVSAEIRSAVSKTLNTEDKGFWLENLLDLKLFRDANVPFTYLETEFYDNTTAMDHYASKREEVAAAIAKVIKKNYS